LLVSRSHWNIDVLVSLKEGISNIN
jgi:hypothetical protein